MYLIFGPGNADNIVIRVKILKLYGETF